MGTIQVRDLFLKTGPKKLLGSLVEQNCPDPSLVVRSPIYHQYLVSDRGCCQGHIILKRLTAGPSRIKMNLVGTGTSVRSPRTTASLSRINADKGLSRTFSSPTRILEASAPFGIFFMKCAFSWKKEFFLINFFFDDALN